MFSVSIRFIVLAVFSAFLFSHREVEISRPFPKDHYEPYEWAGIVRNYPDTVPPTAVYLRNMEKEKLQQSALRNSGASGFNVPWRLEGPTNIGGRINCLAKDPLNTGTFYAGSATGGIWKTTDDCQSWLPVFDDNDYLSVSDIKIRNGNSNVIYAGTGDENIGGYMFVGNGLYRSYDAGITWSNIGLSNTGIISEIILHPTDTNIIYASAMGYPFAADPNRGVYKSTNGGVTWNKILFVNDSAGIIDLVMDPVNPDVLYATSWNRLRNNFKTMVYGPDAHVWCSTNGGVSWNIAANGLPQGNLSRINLAVSGTVSGRVFASFVDTTLELQGIYRSDDFGMNWTAINISTINPGSMGGFGWYFGNIIVNPTDDNEIFFCAVDLYKTDNNGGFWSDNWMTHSDHHDLLYISGQEWLVATDGGIYRTFDDGINWVDADDIPNNQFYRVTWSPHASLTYAGGLQDNGTVTGGFSSINNWLHILGGDGFTVLYHPSNPNIIYGEIQNGAINVSTDGGQTFSPADIGIDFSDRRNWDMPYVFNPQNPDEIFTGTFRPYINYTGVNTNWVPVGGDITDGIIYGARFHTVSAVDWSPLNSNHLLAGTSDANVWFSFDKGLSWAQINTGLPDRYVTSVHFSPNTTSRIYATVSGYKDGINQPHIFRSDNNGTVWNNISGNLPQLAVNDVMILPGNDNVLFAATDGGVYGTTDGGINWARAGSNMPFVPVYDVDFDPVERNVIAGTFGRSMYTVNVDSILSGVGIKYPVLNSALDVFPTVTSGFVNIKGDYKMLVVKVYSVDGKLVKTVLLNSGNDSVDLSALNTGVYLLKAEENKKQGCWRVLKN